MPKVSEPNSNSNASSNIPVLTVTTKERYDVGENIVVNFAFESSKTDVYDWIGIYSSAEKKNGDYLTYNYVGKAGEINGFVTFVVKAYGTYHFRYVRNQVVFARCQVEVGPVIELKADLKQKEDNSRFIEISTKAVFGSIPSKAWIGLFHKAEPNFKNWIQWDHYYSKAPLQFTNALKPGIYICRLFSVYDVLAVSNEIVITGEDIISVEIKKELEITYELKTILNPYWEGAWFGLFTSSETDDHLWKLYCKVVDSKGVAKIKLPAKSGSYDIRLFSGSKLIKRTPAFEVKL